MSASTGAGSHRQCATLEWRRSAMGCACPPAHHVRLRVRRTVHAGLSEHIVADLVRRVRDEHTLLALAHVARSFDDRFCASTRPTNFGQHSAVSHSPSRPDSGQSRQSESRTGLMEVEPSLFNSNTMYQRPVNALPDEKGASALSEFSSVRRSSNRARSLAGYRVRGSTRSSVGLSACGSGYSVPTHSLTRRSVLSQSSRSV